MLVVFFLKFSININNRNQRVIHKLFNAQTGQFTFITRTADADKQQISLYTGLVVDEYHTGQQASSNFRRVFAVTGEHRITETER